MVKFLKIFIFICKRNDRKKNSALSVLYWLFSEKYLPWTFHFHYLDRDKYFKKNKKTNINNKFDQEITKSHLSSNVWTVERFLYKFIDRIYHNQQWFIGLPGGLHPPPHLHHRQHHSYSAREIINVYIAFAFSSQFYKR